MEFSKYVVLLEYFLIECVSETCVRLGAVAAWHQQNFITFRTPRYFAQDSFLTPQPLAIMDFKVTNTPRDPFFETDGTPSFKFLMHALMSYNLD